MSKDSFTPACKACRNLDRRVCKDNTGCITSLKTKKAVPPGQWLEVIALV
jgi:hypothetical protein